jgi:RND family efflux transporter MFP subunit
MKTDTIALPVFKRILLLLAPVFLLVSCGSGEDGEPAVQRDVLAVEVVEAREQDVQTRLHAVGRLVSKNAPILASEINARVIEVLVDEGLRVEKGQVLVRLDTTAFELARQEATAAIERLTVSIGNEERRVNRYRNLQTTNAMSQERLDDAEAKLASDRASLSAARARLAIAEDRLAKAELVSPVDGTVERRHVSVGDYVRAADPMISVTDTINLRVELPFPETVGHLLQPGQQIELESPLAPGQIHKAVIEQIRPQVGQANRSLVVISDIRNPGPWRPEATVRADVVVDNRPGAVVVPVTALVERPAGMVVYVLDKTDSEVVRQQVVEPGERQDGWIEILSGLEAGQLVVGDGAYYLTDGARVIVRETQS